MTIAWQVYAIARLNHDVRHAAFAVGMIGLAQFLPLFALTLTAGETADRHDRRLIAAICLAVDAATAASLAVLAFVDQHGALADLCRRHPVRLGENLPQPGQHGARADAGAQGVAAQGDRLEFIVRAERLDHRAGAGRGAVRHLAGRGLRHRRWPLPRRRRWLLFLISGVTKPAAQAGSRWDLVKEGLGYVWSNKIVFGAISLDLFAVLLGGATALLPVYARDVLNVGPQGFGVLRAGPAVGASLVGILLAIKPIRRHAGIIMFCGVAVFGAATVVFALSKSLALSVAALAVLGGADMLSVYVRQTLVQIVTPDQMRGRVAAVSTLFIGASNELGEFESGVVARLLGPVGAALFGGVGALAVTALWAKLFPALRKADRLA